jgi:hypothetical protein
MTTLSDVYDETLRHALQTTRPEQVNAMLHLWQCRQRVSPEQPFDPEPADEPYEAHIVLALDSSDGPPHAARYFVLASAPSAAVLVAPIWLSRRAGELSLPDLASRPDERDDGLVIVGQDEAGQRRSRSYRWDGQRWQRRHGPLGMTEAQHGSSFLPLFPMTASVWEEAGEMRARIAPEMDDDEWRAHTVRGMLQALHLVGLAPRAMKEQMRQALRGALVDVERGN